MLELANAIAFFIRQAAEGSDKASKVEVRRYKRQDAEVRVDGAHFCYVEWFKGGARIGRRRFLRDEITKQFNIDEVRERVVELVKEKVRQAERLQAEKDWEGRVKVLRTACSNDPRVTVGEPYTFSNEAKKVRVEFTTPDLIAASMVIEWLCEFSYDGADLAPKPSLATARYELNGAGYSFRQLARMVDMTDADVAAIAALGQEMSCETSQGTVTRWTARAEQDHAAKE